MFFWVFFFFVAAGAHIAFSSLSENVVTVIILWWLSLPKWGGYFVCVCFGIPEYVPSETMVSCAYFGFAYQRTPVYTGAYAWIVHC